MTQPLKPTSSISPIARLNQWPGRTHAQLAPGTLWRQGRWLINEGDSAWQRLRGSACCGAAVTLTLTAPLNWTLAQVFGTRPLGAVPTPEHPGTRGMVPRLLRTSYGMVEAACAVGAAYATHRLGALPLPYSVAHGVDKMLLGEYIAAAVVGAIVGRSGVKMVAYTSVLLGLVVPAAVALVGSTAGLLLGSVAAADTGLSQLGHDGHDDHDGSRGPS